MRRRPRGKVVRSTAEQINRLVDYMSTHRLFACNEFTGPHGTQRMEAEWVHLKAMLAAYGPDKSVDQWKHTWRDLRKKAREEAVRARVAHNRTGDAASIPELTENNKKILFTIGQNGANSLGAQENGVGSQDDGAMPTLQVTAEGVEQDFEYVSVEPDVEMMMPGAGAPASAPASAPAPPRWRRARPAPPPPPAPHWAALVRAQIRTNRILQELTAELRIATRHRKRERIKGGVHFLKF